VFRVVAIARQSLPELRLLVVGGGPLERRFRRLAREHGIADATTFTGHVHPSVVRDHVLSADAGILYYEPRHANLYRESMKLREMLAMGLPVVCNDIGELARFAPWTYQGATGYESVAAELVRLLRTGADGRERAGMAYIRANLGWPTLGGRLYARLVRAVGGDIHEEHGVGTNPADSYREHSVPAGTVAFHDR
jgi:phosphatidylinositol alpha-1,6-mannosyltransferase